MTIIVCEAIPNVGLKEIGRFKDIFAAKAYCLAQNSKGKDVAVNDPYFGLMWPDVNPKYFE